jgi:hypothetical protein
MRTLVARVTELVDVAGLKPAAFGRTGSIPVLRTMERDKHASSMCLARRRSNPLIVPRDEHPAR